MKSRLVPLLWMLVAGCARHETVPPPATLPSVRVQVAPVQAENLPQPIDIAGSVRPVRRAVIAARVIGQITELRAALGQTVKSGDVLLKIFAADAEARVEQARVQLNSAKRDLEREQSLVKEGASTAETVRILRDRVAGGEAALREEQELLRFAEIRAPFDGTVSRRMANTGDLAAPGQPLLELDGVGDFEIEAHIPESLSAALTIGASLTCEAGGSVFTGMLSEISSAADPATRSIGVKIAVPSGAPVRAGQFIRVRVPGPVAQTLLAPVSAVTISGQMERVFVVGDGNRAVLRLVKTGGIHGSADSQRIEILSGLAAGDRVVIAPPAGLREGQPLEVQP